MTTKIIGTGSYLPERVVTNSELSNIVDTSDEWIYSRTGIKERRIAESVGTSGMAVNAAMAAIEDAGIMPEDIDIIIVATSSSDNSFPSCACEVQGAVKAVNAVAFDISAACSGFIFALNTVNSFFQAGIYKTGLVIGAETFSRMVDWEDRTTCVLFGDGAGAAVVKAEENGNTHMVMRSDGSKGSVLSCQNRNTMNFIAGEKTKLGYTFMDGQEVFRFAVKKVPECINELMNISKTDIDDIKYFIMHQANYRIIESVAKRLKISIDKFPMNIEKYGNTSGASVPILLDEMNKNGKLKSGDKIVLEGFGAGLTWGAIMLEW